MPWHNAESPSDEKPFITHLQCYNPMYHPRRCKVNNYPKHFHPNYQDLTQILLYRWLLTKLDRQCLRAWLEPSSWQFMSYALPIFYSSSANPFVSGLPSAQSKNQCFYSLTGCSRFHLVTRYATQLFQNLFPCAPVAMHIMLIHECPNSSLTVTCTWETPRSSMLSMCSILNSTRPPPFTQSFSSPMHQIIVALSNYCAFLNFALISSSVNALVCLFSMAMRSSIVIRICRSPIGTIHLARCA